MVLLNGTRAIHCCGLPHCHWDFLNEILGASNFQPNFCNWYLRCLLWNSVRWLSLDLTDEKSALVELMAWCPQATSHFLSDLDLSWDMKSLGYNQLMKDLGYFSHIHGRLDPSGAEDGIFQENKVNSVADALAPCVARSSAAMVLTVQDNDILIFHEARFQPYMASHFEEMMQTYFYISKNNSAYKVLTKASRTQFGPSVAGPQMVAC